MSETEEAKPRETREEGANLARTLRRIVSEDRGRFADPKPWPLADTRLWAAVIGLALVFLFALIFYMYLAIIRPIAQNDSLIDLKENLELQALTLQNDIIDLDRARGDIQGQVGTLRAELGDLESAIESRHAELRAVEEELASAPPPPPPRPAAQQPSQPSEASRIGELERAVATRDRQLRDLRAEKQREEENLARRIVALEQQLEERPTAEEAVIQDRRRFVIDELMAKAGLVAKRNAVQLAFAKALMEAASIYDSDDLAIPRETLRRQFFIKYPQLRAIPVLSNGRAIIEAQLRNTELDLLEDGPRETLVNLVNRYLEFNATAMEAPLILQVSPQMNQGEFDRELDRLDRAYVEFFLDLENMRRFLLTAQ